MELLNECLCDGQLEELVQFLRGMEQFCFVVSSTNTDKTATISSNTIRDIAYEMKNDRLVCPIHGCKIIVPETSLLIKHDDINYKKNKRKR